MIKYLHSFFKEENKAKMKTAIVYYSRHHENTKKLLDAIAEKHEVTLIDATKPITVNLGKFDRIGLASGIYYSKFHSSVLKFAQDKLPVCKDVFLIYTYGAEKKGYTDAIRKALQGTDSRIIGEFGCFGFNTFGPFRLVGGIAKGHPTPNDIENAIEFYEGLENA